MGRKHLFVYLLHRRVSPSLIDGQRHELHHNFVGHFWNCPFFSNTFLPCRRKCDLNFKPLLWDLLIFPGTSPMCRWGTCVAKFLLVFLLYDQLFHSCVVVSPPPWQTCLYSWTLSQINPFFLKLLISGICHSDKTINTTFVILLTCRLTSNSIFESLGYFKVTSKTIQLKLMSACNYIAPTNLFCGWDTPLL